MSSSFNRWRPHPWHGIDVGPMLDGGEADDKIIAVLENDHVWANVNDISELPPSIVERLRHYFSTYKVLPGEESKVHVGDPTCRESDSVING